MPRAIWSGAVSFGLVSIPVKLYNAVSRKSVHFNQIDSRSGARIRYKKVSDADGEEVPSEAIVKGYQLASGDYVLLGDDELGALDPEASRTVEIEQFVDLDEIDPIFYDAAYYAAPDKAARKPYALLVKAMEEQGRVAIARFVMRSKQYLAVLRADDGMLVLSTMVYADEVNDPAELGEFDGVDDVDVSDRELRMARQLVDSLTEEFDPGKFEDTYRFRVLDLIERKASGEEVLAPPAPAAEEKLVDLMAALEESVREAKESRKRHPTAKDEEEAAGERKKAPAKAAAKRRSA
jgi:DNA end-binding protein Ku